MEILIAMCCAAPATVVAIFIGMLITDIDDAVTKRRQARARAEKQRKQREKAAKRWRQ